MTQCCNIVPGVPTLITDELCWLQEKSNWKVSYMLHDFLGSFEETTEAFISNEKILKDVFSQHVT